MRQDDDDAERRAMLLIRIYKQATSLLQLQNRSLDVSIRAKERERDGVVPVFPLASLPPEILGEIFRHFHPWYSDALDPGCPPLSLLRVCHLWRRVALATPAIWTTLAIDFEYGLGRSSWDSQSPLARNLPRVVEVADEWLTRARSLPLDISIRGFSSLGDVSAAPLLDLLERHAPRIGRLSLQLDELDVGLLANYHMDFAQLVELDVDMDDCGHGGDYESYEMLANAPRLRNISLRDVPLDCIDAPLHQVTECKVHLLSVEECLQALASLPQLSRCKLIPNLPHGRRTFPIITHKQVRELNLTLNEDQLQFALMDEPDFEPPTHIINFLTLPSLESLEISDTDEFDLGLLRAFVERSTAPLRSLTFEPAGTQTLENMDALTALNRLEILTLGSPSSDCISQLADALATDAKCLPQLRNLTVSVSSFDELLDVSERIASALAGRHALDANLRLASLRMVVDHNLKFTDMPFDQPRALDVLLSLLPLKDDGTKVHIGTKEFSVL